MTKKEIITEMVRNGYNLMGRPVEWYEANFTVEELQGFFNRYMSFKA